MLNKIKSKERDFQIKYVNIRQINIVNKKNNNYNK